MRDQLDSLDMSMATTAGAFQDDLARDLDLRRLGFDVRRFSELQVNNQAEEVAADLRDALALAS